MDYALEIKGVSKKYDGFKLDNVDLKLPTGFIMGLIGENGAGKSTLIKLILDLIYGDSGTISILGHDNKKDMKLVKEHIGVVMDESCFPENLSPKNINVIMKNIYKTWKEDRFQFYIKHFDLPNDKIIKEYSRGMKMKLSIAVALSHDSKLLILDEATSGLDPIVRDEILDVFLEFIQDEYHSILMSSHIISDLEKACDYITLLHKGRIIFSNIKDDLIESHGILKCSPSQFETIDKSAVKGYRKNNFGVEALVLRDKIHEKYIIDPPNIEDIMLYYIKEVL